MAKYYHATSCSDAAKFLTLRCVKPIHVIEFEIPDDIEVEEQFDHNESFFGCNVYGVLTDIPSKYWTNFYIVE